MGSPAVAHDAAPGATVVVVVVEGGRDPGWHEAATAASATAHATTNHALGVLPCTPPWWSTGVSGV